MSEAELFYRLSEDRLRLRCRWAGIALLLGVVVPYEVIDDQPQFLWQLFDELPPSGVIAGLAPALAGVLVLVAAKLSKRAASLAVVVLASLAGAALCHKIGADAAAWGLLPVPASFSGRATSVLLALSLTAAGSNLAFRRATRRVANLLLVSAVVAALAFYLWPGRGQAPGALVLDNLAAIPEMPTIHFKLGALTLVTVALWPAIIALIGLLHIWRPPARNLSVMGMVALGGFPLLLMMLLFSWYLRTSPGAALFGAVGAAVEIAAEMALTAAALETLGQALGSSERAEHAQPDGWPLARVAAAAAGVLALVAGGQWWLARPPAKGVSWTLGEPNADADQLYGELVIKWSNARWGWDLRVRRDSSATAMLDVKARGRDMVLAAQAIDPQLGEAFSAMARAGSRLDVSSRSWHRLVAEANEASRVAGLPYYLDPRVSITKTKEGLRRHFLVDTYRVVRVRRFRVDGDEYATLHVRGVGPLRAGHHVGLLGFSRDVQPFALVVLDTIQHHYDEVRSGARETPPRCGNAFDPAAEQAMLHCGKVLVTMLENEQAAIKASVDEVERHELQHQIDGPLLSLARPVLEKLAGYTDEAKERTNRELSAYVAQLTQASSPAKLGLIMPLRFALLSDGGTYHHAGVLLFEALVDRRVRDPGGDVDPTLVREAFDELVALPDDALRRRAAETWERLYGDELPTVERIDEAVAPDEDAP